MYVRPEGKYTLHATIMYQIPEPFQTGSPSFRAMLAEGNKKENRRNRKDVRLVFSTLARNPQWERMALEGEIRSRLASALIEWEWGQRRNKRLMAAFYADEPTQIVEQIVSSLCETGSAINDYMKGAGTISWNEKRIREIVEKLLGQHSLRIERSYTLKTSTAFEQEGKRVKASMDRMFKQVVGELITNGKLKSVARVPRIERK